MLSIELQTGLVASLNLGVLRTSSCACARLKRMGVAHARGPPTATLGPRKPEAVRFQKARSATEAVERFLEALWRVHRTQEVPVRIALAVLLCVMGMTCLVQAGESKGGLFVSEEVGKLDNEDWETTFFQTTVQATFISEWLVFEMRGRGWLSGTQEEEGVKEETNGYDFRGLFGWRWASTEQSLTVLGGVGQRSEQVAWSDDYRLRFKSSLTTLDLGLRGTCKLAERVTWCAEVTGGPALYGQLEKSTTNDALYLLNEEAFETEKQHGAWFMEARTGLSWRLTENLSLYTGAAFERTAFKFRDTDYTTDKLAGQLGLTLAF